MEPWLAGGGRVNKKPQGIYEDELECTNIVFDNFSGMAICADNGIVLAENLIDDDEISFFTIVPRRVLERMKKERGVY